MRCVMVLNAVLMMNCLLIFPIIGNVINLRIAQKQGWNFGYFANWQTKTAYIIELNTILGGQFDMLERFTEFIKSTVTSLEFMLKSKRNPKDFTRNRKLSFSMNILLVLSILNHSIQTGIDQFLIEVETCFDTYSKQAFSQGRQRILPEAFWIFIRSRLNFSIMKPIMKPTLDTVF